LGSSLLQKSGEFAEGGKQTCTVLMAEAGWELLAWLGQVVAMVALLQALMADTSGELVAQQGTAVFVVLDRERSALLVVLAAEGQEMALFHMSAPGRGSTYRKRPTNTLAVAVTSTWFGRGETSLA